VKHEDKPSGSLKVENYLTERPSAVEGFYSMKLNSYLFLPGFCVPPSGYNLMDWNKII
jgi:hypothetical protein